MKFFANAGGGRAELSERFGAYKDYLQTVKGQLPVSAFEFATAKWHYDHSDHRCPHDSWLESLTIAETGTGQRFENRSFNICVRLLGPFQDGHVVLDYTDVRMYSLENSKGQSGHGDWLIDEIRLSENGLVLHEVVFSSQCRWLIEARDISCEWRPKS